MCVPSDSSIFGATLKRWISGDTSSGSFLGGGGGCHTGTVISCLRATVLVWIIVVFPHGSCWERSLIIRKKVVFEGTDIWLRTQWRWMIIKAWEEGWGWKCLSWQFDIIAG